MNYQQANEQLQGRCKHSRKVANNTYLKRNPDDSIALRLHETDIVTWFPTGQVIVNSGGWFTRTTFDRLNEYVDGFRFSTEKRIPYVYSQDFETRWHWDRDSFVITADGKPDLDDFDPEVEKQQQRELKRLRKYCKAYVEAFARGEVSKPSAGDCFYCQFVDKQTGNMIGGPEHILSHVDESYYVPSLLVHAIKAYPVSEAGRMWISGIWHNDTRIKTSNWFGGVCSDQVFKSLYRFCCRELGYGG